MSPPILHLPRLPPFFFAVLDQCQIFFETGLMGDTRVPLNLSEEEVPRLRAPPPTQAPPAGSKPSVVPKSAESLEILKGLQGWCLATGCGQSEGLPDLKLRFDRHQISGHSSVQDELGTVQRGNCKGLVTVQAGST